MANKRIELEQHQRFTDLLEEYPNSSRRKKGLTIVFIAAMLLVITFMALGFASNNLAKDAGNLLKKPESEKESITPENNQFTLPQSPTESVPPSGSPTTPSSTQIEIPLPQENPSHSRSHSRQSYTMHKKTNSGEADVLSANESELLAMASLTSSEAGLKLLAQGGKPASSPKKATKKSEKKPLEKQTKGIGNLSNLANAVDARGFFLYLACLSLVLIAVLYASMRKARRGRRQ
ncbi:MAG: hypothetical protein PHO53_07290 [Actinomycetota bacterium]|nr:hypothetical protein [Actinomycetota bacterium]